MNEIIKLKNKGESGSVTVNFLLNQDDIFISDNHRTAMWCWLQSIDLREKYGFLHIDQHADAVPVNLSEFYSNKLIIEGSDINSYLNLKNSFGSELITWDNYLYAFLYLYSDNIYHYILSTHGQNDDSWHFRKQEVNFWELLENFENWLDRDSEWIVNLDIDYFFVNYFEKKTRAFTDEYIEIFSGLLGDLLVKKKIKVLTIALSPEWCGDWFEAEKVAKIICKGIGVNYPY